MRPNKYPTKIAQVGLFGFLLITTQLAWFVPLQETRPPLLENFDSFIKVFQDTCGVRKQSSIFKGYNKEII